MSDEEWKPQYSNAVMESAAKTLEEIDDIERYQPSERLMHMLNLTAHMNYHLMSGLYLELVELRMTIEKASKNAQGT